MQRWASKDCWFDLLVIKTASVKKLDAAFPMLYGHMLQMFWDPDGHSMDTTGCFVQLAGGGNLHVFADFGALLADEAAIHTAYSNKGAAGYRPCILCKNVANARSTRPLRRGDVTHVCHEWNSIELHTNDSLLEVARHLARVSEQRSRAELEEEQTRYGWAYQTQSILWRPEWFRLASPASIVVFDWMHVVFVGGVFNVHVGHMVHATKEFGLTGARLSEYVSAWRWPVAVGSTTGVDVFGPQRFAASWEAWSLRATGSEGLSLVPVLANRMQAVLDDASSSDSLKKHAACFLMLARIVEMLLASSRRGRMSVHICTNERELVSCDRCSNITWLQPSVCHVPWHASLQRK